MGKDKNNVSLKINRVGNRYGKLLVIREDCNRGGRGQIKWVCKCDCGTTSSVLADNLRTGTTRSCGCLRFEQTINEIGNVYGKLEVLGRAKNQSGTRSAYWLCYCDCGKEKVINGKSLRSGESKSCGHCSRPSLVLRSGFSSHYLYHTWSSIVARCYNENNPDYCSYGKLGIKLYEDWHVPENFFRWMDTNLGPRPEGCSLDRINVYGGYEPGNLRWADSLTQVNNRRLVLLSEEEYGFIMERRKNTIESPAVENLVVNMGYL